jgi:hypothetical protein
MLMTPQTQHSISKETTVNSVLTSFAPTAFVFLLSAAAPPVIAAAEPCALITMEQVSTTMGVSMAAKSPTPRGAYGTRPAKVPASEYS